MPALSTVSADKPEIRKRPLRLRINSWLRWLHTYLSMLTMGVVLFFSLTGIVLNHPEWTFGMDETRTELNGTFPKEWVTGKEVKWLEIAEKIRSEYKVRGIAGNYDADDREGTLTFKGPAYAADVFFERETGDYTLTVTRQGPIAVLNDLHRGRDAGTSWAWLVDLSGIFLVVISLSGLGLILYLKKVKMKGLVTFVVGCILLLILMKLAT